MHVYELTTWTKNKVVPDTVGDFLKIIHLVSDREYELQLEQESWDLSAQDFLQHRNVAVVCL